MPYLLAVDGNSLGHRAFHSSWDLEGRPVAARVTGAVVSMLASAWVHGPYDAVLVAFDHPVNRRRSDYPEYKAGRPATPAELSTALRALGAHLRDCGFAVEVRDGAEADDVLAGVVDACEDRDWACDLLSSDRDLTALVGPRTRLLRPRQHFADLQIEDVAAVQARYGVHPRQYPDLAALRGDPADGLVGANGIGPKIAARLIRDHGSVAGLYDRLHQLAPRVEASLRLARDRVERNLLLMAPIPHLRVDVDAAVDLGVDPDRVVGALAPLGLEQVARRFHRSLTAPPRPPVVPPPTDHDVPTHRPARPPAADQGEQDQLF